MVVRETGLGDFVCWGCRWARGKGGNDGMCVHGLAACSVGGVYVFVAVYG